MEIDWLEPWEPVADPEERKALEAELAKELGPRHRLYRQPASLIARRGDTDDALFALDNGEVAEVCLTWKGEWEADPQWPSGAVYASIEVWARRSMVPAHLELTEAQEVDATAADRST